MQPLIYTHTTSLASGIPLGGLGAGSVEIRDDGLFHDWEIFNNYQFSGNQADLPPEMWSEDAFFAIRAQPAGEHPRVRLLYDDDKKSRATAEWYDYAQIYNYPFLRNVQRISYSSRHPFAKLDYTDPGLPLRVELQAFTPFIPHHAKESGLPMAYFVFAVTNTSDKPCDVSLMFSLRNCVGYDQDKLTLTHQVQRSATSTSIIMGAEDIDPSARTAGTMAISALSPTASVMPAWTNGRGQTGFTNPAAPAMSQLFYPFRDTGRLDGEDGDWRREISKRAVQVQPDVLHADRQSGWQWRGALCQQKTLAPGESVEMTFLMSWHFPNHYHYSTQTLLGHAYENWFADAGEVAAYGCEHFISLHTQSRRFVDEFYRGTLAPWLADSLNAQLTTFPQTFWWCKDGSVAAWEGSACCQIIPNLHTIWSSWGPLLFFPELYLANKKAAIRFATDDAARPCCRNAFLDAEVAHRSQRVQEAQADLGGWIRSRWHRAGYSAEDFSTPKRGPASRAAFLYAASPCQLLRDWQWSGDRELLELVWPLVKESIERGIIGDLNEDGLPDGAISFLTYDHWFPPATNCYRGTMWLADVRIAAELATIIGDTETAQRYAQILQTGAATFERLYWNGSYYNFAYDFRRELPDSGCLADQVSGQLYLRLCGLAGIHPDAHVRSALAAVFKYNRKPEEGLLNGADPEGRTDWSYFARYSDDGADETRGGQWVTPWTGTEYYVAATMIAEGLVEEGLTVARDVYERYTAAGLLYNHLECGEHYFRALAAWAMLPALQGLTYEANSGNLHFAPRDQPDKHDSILLLPSGWGHITQRRTSQRQRDVIAIIDGVLRLRRITLELPVAAEGKEQAITVRLNREDHYQRLSAQHTRDGQTIYLSLQVDLSAGQQLTINVQW